MRVAGNVKELWGGPCSTPVELAEDLMRLTRYNWTCFQTENNQEFKGNWSAKLTKNIFTCTFDVSAGVQFYGVKNMNAIAFAGAIHEGAYWKGEPVRSPHCGGYNILDPFSCFKVCPNSTFFSLLLHRQRFLDIATASYPKALKIIHRTNVARMQMPGFNQIIVKSVESIKAAKNDETYDDVKQVTMLIHSICQQLEDCNDFAWVKEPTAIEIQLARFLPTLQQRINGGEDFTLLKIERETGLRPDQLRAGFRQIAQTKPLELINKLKTQYVLSRILDEIKSTSESIPKGFVTRLANHVHWSPATLTRNFQSTYGLNPTQMLERKRL